MKFLTEASVFGGGQSSFDALPASCTTTKNSHNLIISIWRPNIATILVQYQQRVSFLSSCRDHVYVWKEYSVCLCFDLGWLVSQPPVCRGCPALFRCHCDDGHRQFKFFFVSLSSVIKTNGLFFSLQTTPISRYNRSQLTKRYVATIASFVLSYHHVCSVKVKGFIITLCLGFAVPPDDRIVETTPCQWLTLTETRETSPY